MKKISISTLYRWMTEERETALRWISGVKHVSDPKQIEAYQAGFDQGWGKLRALLSLHGYIVLDERN